MPEIELDGLSIHYDVLGEGEPIAFLNGVMMTAQSWVLQTSMFRQRYRCVMHDFRGQLLSSKPTTPWSMEDHVEDFRAVVDALEIERFHVVGTSYGGEVGMLFAAAYPERVKSLSLISCVSRVDPELEAAVAGWRDAALEAPETLCRVSLPFNFSPSFIAAHADVLAQGEARLAGCPPAFFDAFARLIDAFQRLDATEALAHITCPTLVVVGELDALKPPRCSREIADRISTSELLLVPDAGHAVIIEKPEEVNAALLGFIAKHG
ncbi:MAG: alpha/beta hydrolase [Acidobacteriota bacterium]|nr:alpha/beta hydrolase [Acidobacteriota bacterium]